MNPHVPILCFSLGVLPAAVFTQARLETRLSPAEKARCLALGQNVFESFMPVALHQDFTGLPVVSNAQTPPAPVLFFATPLTDLSAAPVVRFLMPAPDDPNSSTEATVPMYDRWVRVLRDQPRPRRANEFLPRIKRIFAEEGVPEELAWIPEVESTFDPCAHNASGACGLFQLMPITARAQGLRLWPYDERTHPEKSARAAATLLRDLHAMFDSWPLALAAYNAGEGRVRRTLRAGDASTFAEIADALPNETRRYVPRVLATLTVREGIVLADLPAPR